MTKRVEEDEDVIDDAPAPFVQTFGRGLAVIAAFDHDNPMLTVADTARRAGVTRAAARRLLLTLVQLGYVRMEGRFFALRPKVLELGYAYLSALTLPELALPYMHELAEQVHESAYLSVLDGQETVCVANVPVRRIWSASITVGTRLPAYATAAGRVILAARDDAEIDAFLASANLVEVTPHTKADPEQLRAELRAVRANGYALVDHELEEGLRTVAAPIHRQSGEVLAALSFSTLAGRVEPEVAREEMLPPLIAAAASVEADVRSLEHADIPV